MDTLSWPISSAIDGIFLLYLPLRLSELLRLRASPSHGRQGQLKLVLGLLLSAHALLCVVKLASLFSSATSLAATVGLSLLLHLEQQRSSNPSDLGTLYLLASATWGLITLTTSTGSTNTDGGGPVARRAISTRCLLQCLLFFLECLGPRSVVTSVVRAEEDNGILSRLLLGWVHPLLLSWHGAGGDDMDLPHLNADMRLDVLRSAMVASWNQQRRAASSSSALPVALVRCIRWRFVAPVLPRLFMILFRCSQPALVRQIIQFAGGPSPPSSEATRRGHQLVISALAIYVGLAVSTAAYQLQLAKVKVATRGAIVGLIHHQTLRSPSRPATAGEATTLMSTDADELAALPEIVHETWSQTMEVAIGIILLAREVGRVWPLPILLIFIGMQASRRVSRHLRQRQKTWNAATQDRVAALGSMLGSIKMIKMLGWQDHLGRRIRALRGRELDSALAVRWITVYYNLVANGLGIFSAPVTLMVFSGAVAGGSLDSQTAFTTMAILSMITRPANTVTAMIPRLAAAFASFERVQAYLTKPSQLDQRESPAAGTLLSSSGNPAVAIRGLCVRGHGDGGSDARTMLLADINVCVPRGGFLIVAGPVGSGKSTLLQAILGETCNAIVGGSIEVSCPSRRTAYCAQKPWLPNGSIREVILGPAADHQQQGLDVDVAWYRRVLEACCLDYDIALLPDRDRTLVGSGGCNLSGGQRHRVALARALFSRHDIVLLDEVFSALDGRTEKKVFRNVLSAETGILRRVGATVILVSNSTEIFPAADHIVLLDIGGTIKCQGSWDKISSEVSASVATYKIGSGLGYQKLESAVKDDHTSVSTCAAAAKLNNHLLARYKVEVGSAASSAMGHSLGLGLYKYYFRFAGPVNVCLVAVCTAGYAIFITLPQHWLRLWTESGGCAVFYHCGFLLLAMMSWAFTNGTVWSTMIRLAPESGARFHEHLLAIVSSAPLSFFSATDTGSILNRFSQDLQLIDKQLPSALADLSNNVFKLLVQGILLCATQPSLTLSLPIIICLLYLLQKLYLRTCRPLRILELEFRAAVMSSFLESIQGLETIRAFGWEAATARDNVSRLERSQRAEFLLLCLQRWLAVVLDLVGAGIAVAIIATAIAMRGRDNASDGGGRVGMALNIMLLAHPTLLRLVEAWAVLDVSLGAVVRVKSLENDTSSEFDLGRNPSHSNRLRGNIKDNSNTIVFEPPPPGSLPSAGRIEFRGVTASYSRGTVALQDFTLHIPPGQKVTIRGRTGSGKSSLLLALLRMLPLQSGEISLDGINIANIPHNLLRQRCFVTVSQDALVLPSETLRFHLDPEGLLHDGVLISALRRVGLWSCCARAAAAGDDGGFDLDLNLGSPESGSGVLDSAVSRAFPDISGGQSQLLGLCRGLVRAEALRADGTRPVVLLDEVTSALDSAVEAVVHRIVEREFTGRGHTVVMVSHRVAAATYSGCAPSGGDVVVWMADGKLKRVEAGLEG